MSKILRLCQTLNILSIDIAAGAVICCAFFADILGVSVLPYGFITLGLTVWIIYTVDHLLDVWREKPNPLRQNGTGFISNIFTYSLHRFFSHWLLWEYNLCSSEDPY